MEGLSVINFLQNLDLITSLQWIGVAFGACQVWYAKENKPITYFYGIVSVLISMYVLYAAKLYAEIFLNLYYLVMSIYGWWYWLSRKTQEDKSNRPITFSSLKDWTIAFGIVLITFVIFYSGLVTITDSDVPLWDSLVTAFAWAGMWLLAKRKMENWIFLNVSNAIAIPLQYHKGLPIFAFFTLFLFGMAIWGYIKWLRILKTSKHESTQTY